ncbi:MAG: ABC transporter substrate-binding protein, partial [Steroidobacteraceae bacterium]
LNSSRRLVAAALAALSLTMSSCSSHSPAPLRIALPDWPPAEFLHLAREKGFFSAAGVDVQLVEFSFPSDLQRAIERRRVDGGVLSIFEVLRAQDRAERALQVMLVIDFSNGADAILATGGIADVRALRGRKVGLDGGALSFYVLARALEMHSMTLDDVIVVRTDAAQMPHALAAGSLEAVVTYPPARTQIERATHARPIFTSAQIPGEIVDVLALDPQVLRDRPADAARLVRAFYRAVEFAASNPQEAHAIMARREHLDRRDFGKALHDGVTLVSLENQQRFLGAGSQLPAVMRTANTLMRESGQLVGAPRALPGLDSTAAAAASEP